MIEQHSCRGRHKREFSLRETRPLTLRERPSSATSEARPRSILRARHSDARCCPNIFVTIYPPNNSAPDNALCGTIHALKFALNSARPVAEIVNRATIFFHFSDAQLKEGRERAFGSARGLRDAREPLDLLTGHFNVLVGSDSFSADHNRQEQLTSTKEKRQ